MGRRSSAQLPVNAAEFASLIEPLGPFEPSPTVAVAVSGGADSLALALLTSAWAAARGGCAVALTVDHGLRPESAAEAEQVGRWLAALNIEHHILNWAGEKPRTGVQSAARDARYRLLFDHCRGRGILHLLTAHHQEDQAETVLLRLARGSGMDGLSGMAPHRAAGPVRLLRPLLSVDPARLRATCAAAAQAWVDDPSNAHSRFARPRLRKVVSALAAEGLTADNLVTVARRARRARQALDHGVANALAASCAIFPEGYALLKVEPLAAEPEEIRLRALARCVVTVGGNRYPPRLAALERLARQVFGQQVHGARTLGGCVFSPYRGRLLARREERAIAEPQPLLPDLPVRWDGRFLAVSSGREDLTIGRLHRAAWADLAQKAPHLDTSRIPAAVRWTLPAVFDREGLAAVPHLGYARLGFRPERLSLSFAPEQALTGPD